MRRDVDIIKKIIESNGIDLNTMFNSKGKIYTFLNPVSYIDAAKNKRLYEEFDAIFADGSVLVNAIKLLYGKAVKRRSFDMTSIASDLLCYAERERKSIYIVASKQEEIRKAISILKKNYPKIEIVGYRNGYFNSEEEKDNEIDNICVYSPHFLIVGMGAINQERFVIKAKHAGYKGIGFTCGGFIHQIAKNKIDYYPKWINSLNLRFVYRMYKEPHTRMRYLKSAFVFPVVFLIERLRILIGGGKTTNKS